MKIFHGIVKDIDTRRPHYGSDFSAVFSLKVLSSSFYLFFACLANTIAFGALSSVLTGGEIGIIEMLIATAIGLFAAIPAVIAYNRLAARGQRLIAASYAFGTELQQRLHRLLYARKGDRQPGEGARLRSAP